MRAAVFVQIFKTSWGRDGGQNKVTLWNFWEFSIEMKGEC